jgi:hypothetical protein
MSLLNVLGALVSIQLFTENIALFGSNFMSGKENIKFNCKIPTRLALF